MPRRQSPPDAVHPADVQYRCPLVCTWCQRVTAHRFTGYDMRTAAYNPIWSCSACQSQRYGPAQSEVALDRESTEEQHDV